MKHIQAFERKRPIPRKAIMINILAHFITKVNGVEFEDNWIQLWGNDLYTKQALLDWIKEETGKEMREVMVHVIKGSVPRHVDKMTRECFVFPIRIHSGNVLTVSTDKVSLDNKHFYMFDDYKRHSLSNPSNNRMILLTASSD